MVGTPGARPGRAQSAARIADVISRDTTRPQEDPMRPGDVPESAVTVLRPVPRTGHFRSVPFRRYQGLLVAAFAAGLALTASCGDEGSKVAFPTMTPQISGTTGSSATTPTPEDAVKGAYIAFWDASERATRVPSDQVRATLKNYSTGAYLGFQVRQIISARADNQEPWGTVIRHIGQVQVTDGKATVHDCQDASGAGLADVRTGRLIAGTRGPKQRNLIAYLVRGSDEQWRVYSLKQFKEPCAYSGASSSSP